MTQTTDGRRADQADFDREQIEAIGDPYQRLRVIMKRLFDPGGCPWDREQTHQTLRQYMIEEAFEVAEAIDRDDADELCEELGDVALQVVFHSELAERRGAFDIERVYECICKKLIDRHPHVFGDGHAEDSGTVLRNWEQIKKDEKREKSKRRGDGEPPSALSGVPRALPALQRAARLQEKASRIGFDWDRAEEVALKVREEVEEFLEKARDGSKTVPDERTRAAIETEFGDLLFSLVNLSRFLDIRAEEALSKSSEKFIRRFTAIERDADESGKPLTEMSLNEMDALWDKVKAKESTR